MPYWNLPSHNKDAQAKNKIDPTNRAGGITEHIVIQSLHNGTILLKIKPVQLIFISGAIFWRDLLDDINILIRMESSESLLAGMHIMKMGKFVILYK